MWLVNLGHSALWDDGRLTHSHRQAWTRADMVLHQIATNCRGAFLRLVPG